MLLQNPLSAQRHRDVSCSQPRCLLSQVQVSGETTVDETSVRRNPRNVNGLTTQPFEGIDTVTDVLNYAARFHGDKDAHGTRDIVALHEEEKEIKKTIDGKEVVQKRKWQYFELGPYKYTSYVQIKGAANEIALGFIELGIAKDQNIQYLRRNQVHLHICHFPIGDIYNLRVLTARIGSSCSTPAAPSPSLSQPRMNHSGNQVLNTPSTNQNA